MRKLLERSRGARGASAVEFAIAFPLFLMIVFGGISSAMAYDRQNTLTHAAREGVRYGATLPTNGTTSVPDAWFEQVAAVTQQSASGQLDTGVPGRTICVAYVGYGSKQNVQTSWTRSRTLSGTTVTYSNAPCFADGRPASERRVQVVAARTTEFNVVFFNPTLNLSSNATARFEAVTIS